MVDASENIYAAWDAYVATMPKKASPQFKDFAENYLKEKSQATLLPLNDEQSRVLVGLVDSFVEQAEQRHRNALGIGDKGEGRFEDTAMTEFLTEAKQPLLTEAEINKMARTRGAEFANMSEDAVLEMLHERKGWFGKLKAALLARIGDDFANEIVPYIPEEECAEAKRLFSRPAPELGTKESFSSVVDDMESHKREHIDFIATQAVLARGQRAKDFAEMLSTDENELEITNGIAPQCLVAAFGGQLLSSDETIVRKLTAILFLLVRMSTSNAENKAEECDLPFFAVGAARCAYDWMTESKSAYQCLSLSNALDQLANSTDLTCNCSEKGVAK